MIMVKKNWVDIEDGKNHISVHIRPDGIMVTDYKKPINSMLTTASLKSKNEYDSWNKAVESAKKGNYDSLLELIKEWS